MDLRRTSELLETSEFHLGQSSLALSTAFNSKLGNIDRVLQFAEVIPPNLLCDELCK